MDFIDLSQNADEDTHNAAEKDVVMDTQTRLYDENHKDTQVVQGASPWAPGASQSQAILSVPLSEKDHDNSPLRTSYSNHVLDASVSKRSPTPDSGKPVPATIPHFQNGSSNEVTMHTQHDSSMSEEYESGEEEADRDTFNSIIKTRPIIARTGLVYTSLMMLHTVPSSEDVGETDVHPEQPERISRIFSLLKNQGCVSRMKRIPIREVTESEVTLVHKQSIWDACQRSAFFSHETLAAQIPSLEMSSLYINEHSARCARLSCGGVIEMCDAVASGRIQNGFAIVRPPGHHAEPDRSMGFCLYNNVAVATRYLQEKYGEVEDETRCKRILILDWDVHHGNGTQAAFYDEKDVLYISLHRYEDANFFPGSREGDQNHVGTGPGLGRNINIPWPSAHMTDSDYLAAFSRIVMPIATEFAPDIVIISAGFDAADGDPLGDCHVSPLGYAHMTYQLASLANGRLVVALEGGYNLDAIANSALSVTETLLGETPKAIPPGLTFSTRAEDTFRLVEQAQAPYWKCIKLPHLQVEYNEDEGLPFIELFRLVAEHRSIFTAKQYDLDVLPICGVKTSQGVGGGVLCTPDLLSDPKETLIFFAHDMGSLRSEQLSGKDFYPQQEIFRIVDGSEQVVQWSRENNASLVDVCLHFQLPTVLKEPLPRLLRWQQNREVIPEALQEAFESIVYLWDNYILMAIAQRKARHPNHPMKIVLIGLGAATSVLLHLIETRAPVIQDQVQVVVQLPGHNPIPEIPKGQHELRKWYFKRSIVLLPYDHAFYSFDQQSQAVRRLGNIVRSEERRAIQILRTQFSTISRFVEKFVPTLITRPRSVDRSSQTGLEESQNTSKVPILN